MTTAAHDDERTDADTLEQQEQEFLSLLMKLSPQDRQAAAADCFLIAINATKTNAHAISSLE